MDRVDEEATTSVQKESPRRRYDGAQELKEESEEKGKKFLENYLGIIYAILAGVCAMIADGIVRQLNHYGTSEIIMYRVLVEILLVIPILIQQRIEFAFWSELVMLVLRGALLSTSFFFRTFAIKSLPLTESLPLSSTNPVFTAILARIFLKYRFTNFKISALVTNVIAIVLICHFWTGFDQERILGIGSMFLNVLLYSTSNVVLKILTLDMAPKLVVFHVSWMRFVIMLAMTEITNDLTVPKIPKCPDEYHWYQSESVLIIVMGIAMLGFAAFEAEATKLENPETVVAVETCTILPLALIIQVIVFNDVPNAVVCVGVILVLVSSILINIDGIVMKLSVESPLRKLVSRINN